VGDLTHDGVGKLTVSAGDSGTASLALVDVDLNQEWNIVLNKNTSHFIVKNINSGQSPFKVFVEAVDNCFRVGYSAPDVVTCKRPESLCHFYAYANTSTAIGTSDTAVLFGVEVRSDNDYFSFTGTDLTIVKGGWYEIVAEIDANTSDAVNRQSGKWWLEEWNGSSWMAVPGSKSSTYHRNNVSGRDSCRICVLHNVVAGYKYRVMGLSQIAGTLTTFVEGCRFSAKAV
jgi:hypothetical protein